MKIRNILTSVVMLLLLSGCQQEGWGPDWTPSAQPRYMYLDAGALNFGAQSNLSKTVSVRSLSAPWQFSGMPAWISVSPASGNVSTTVGVAATANTTELSGRTALFDFSSTDAAYAYHTQVRASQAAAIPYVTVDRASLSFAAAAGSEKVTVTSNADWTASTDAVWVTLTPAADKRALTVTVGEHTSTALSRSATILFKYKGTVYATVTLTQAPAALPVTDEATLAFENPGGAYRLSLTSEVSWMATASADWLQVSPEQGSAGQSTLTIEATPNTTTAERTGYVYIIIGGVQCYSVKVVQEGIFLAVDPSSLSLGADESTSNVLVKSNTSWTLRQKPEWIALSSAKGAGSSTLGISASANWSLNRRQGTIVFGVPDTDLEAVLDISQEGRVFPDLVKALLFDGAASQQTVVLDTDGKWTATTTAPSWLTVAPAEGVGPAQLTVAVTDNASDSERSAVVMVSVGDKTQSVAVTQKALYFAVTPSAQPTFTSRGGTHSLAIATNEPSWKGESGAAWLTLTPNSGTGSIDVTLSAADNPSTKERKTTATFTPKNLQRVSFVATQAGRYMRVDATAFTFFGKGGKSQVVTVTTDGTYEITASEPSWLSVGQSENTFTVTAAENNSGADRKATIAIRMTGLNPGENLMLELPVLQRQKTTIDIVPFGDDEQWELIVGSRFSVVVTGFGSDEHWDPVTGTDTYITGTGYDGDQSWDQTTGDDVTGTDYSDDQPWDQTTGDDVTGTPFPDDESWD